MLGALAAPCLSSDVRPRYLHSMDFQRHKSNGADGFILVDLVMHVIQMAGMIITILLLRQVTPLPRSACLVIGLPLFFAVFWGSLWLLFGRESRQRRAERNKYWRDVRRQFKKPDA